MLIFFGIFGLMWWFNLIADVWSEIGWDQGEGDLTGGTKAETEKDRDENEGNERKSN